MSFFSIICVLLLEQIKASPESRVRALQTIYLGQLERLFDAGQVRHGVTAWWVGAALPAALVFLASVALAYFVHPMLAFVFEVALLYLAMGFRQFSHFYTDIQMALRMGEIDHARRLLAEWRGQSADRLSSSEIARLAIEQGILSSHRHVFAPLLWFIFFGAAGAVLYRLSLDMAQQWSINHEVADRADQPEQSSEREFGRFSQQAFRWLDWLPVRLSAVTFAVVGDFEDAIFCWRTQAEQWLDATSGILLASAAGALGIRLGMPLPGPLGMEARPELGLGEDAAVEHLQSAIGLLWRALVLCLLLLALLSIASWVGG